jgi:quercetin dioxygenase-like cupin family protein
MPPRLAVIIALLLGVDTLRAQGPAVPPGFTVTPVLDNATLTVIRLKIAPGAKEQPHTHPYPMLVIVLTRSEMEMHNGGAHTKGVRKPGDVEFVAAGIAHNAANVGTTPLEALVLAIKPERVRGGAVPPRQAVPGIIRQPILEKAEVSVTRVEIEADVREPVHTHPYDLAVVPSMHARLDVQVGDKKNVRSYATGEMIFIPRNVPHAVANGGTTTLQMLGIVIK